VLGLGAPEILEQILGADEVDAEAVLDGPEAEGDREVGLPHAGRRRHILRSFSGPSSSTMPGIPSLASA
jgi:hypothetical protein